MPKDRKPNQTISHQSLEQHNEHEGSPDVTFNNKPVHRVGDERKVRAGAKDGKPAGKTKKGSSTVFVNDRALGHLGDENDSSGRLHTGSDDIHVED